MAGRVVKPPGTVASLSIRDDGQKTSTTDAAGLQVQQAVQALQATGQRQRRQIVKADLAVGRNVVRHSLGHAARGYSLTATVADASFAHAIDLSNPNPDREVWINVIGVAQRAAQIEVW